MSLCVSSEPHLAFGVPVSIWAMSQGELGGRRCWERPWQPSRRPHGPLSGRVQTLCTLESQPRNSHLKTELTHPRKRIFNLILSRVTGGSRPPTVASGDPTPVLTASPKGFPVPHLPHGCSGAPSATEIGFPGTVQIPQPLVSTRGCCWAGPRPGPAGERGSRGAHLPEASAFPCVMGM